MNAFETIWSFRTAQFRVTVDAGEDFDLDLSWDDDGSVRAGLESGKLTSFMVRARCVHVPSGAETEDFLGGCIHESVSDFRDHVGINEKGRRDGCNYGSYFSDMVRTVTGEMRDKLRAAAAVKLRA